MAKTRIEIAQAVKDDLEELGIKPSQASRMAGLSAGMLSAVLSSRQGFGKKTAASLHEVFGYNIRFLLCGEGTLRDEATDEGKKESFSAKKNQKEEDTVFVLTSFVHVAENIISLTGNAAAVKAWEGFMKGDFNQYREAMEILGMDVVSGVTKLVSVKMAG